MNEASPLSTTPIEGVPVEQPQQNFALLTEMMRSFSTLARTLNLSHAVRELHSTRQTVRRHITLLEEAKGTPLFVVEDRQYHLTDAGMAALPEANEILARSKFWLSGGVSHVQGLQRIEQVQGDWSFYQQRRSLADIWDGPSLLLRESLRSWTMSSGQIEHEKLQHVRPYLMVYRRTPSGWICVEMGEKSFYSLWFGWSTARSSIGRPLNKMPGGEDFALLVNRPFEDIRTSRGCRLDAIYTQIPRENADQPIPIGYYRLLMGGTFPDGSFALIAAVDRTPSIGIEGLSDDLLDTMPKDPLLDFSLQDAKCE